MRWNKQDEPVGAATGTELAENARTTTVNLERARALLGSAQSADDIAPMVNESVDPATTHALVSPSDMRFFGANSLMGHFCLIAVDDAAGSSVSTCAPPERFARDGVWVGTIADGVNLTLRWDGEKVTETRTPQ